MVYILVGPDKERYIIHRDLICNVAPYFRAVFEGQFAESSTQTLELSCEHENRRMFEAFLQWAYSGKVLRDGEDTSVVSWGTLVDLYIFGSMRDIPLLQNCAIDLIINKHIADQNRTPVAQIRKIWENSGEESHLRRLIIDMSACKGDLANWFCYPDNYDLFCMDFMFQLATKLFQFKEGKEQPVKDFGPVRTRYHVKPADYETGNARGK